MKLEIATLADSENFGNWAEAKLKQGYLLTIEELKGTVLKVDGCFYVPARHAILLGPLIPNPEVDGTKLTIALHRMIKDIRKSFKGDIIYPNLSENGVDEAAKNIGGFEEYGKLMILRGEKPGVLGT